MSKPDFDREIYLNMFANWARAFAATCKPMPPELTESDGTPLEIDSSAKANRKRGHQGRRKGRNYRAVALEIMEEQAKHRRVSTYEELAKMVGCKPGNLRSCEWLRKRHQDLETRFRPEIAAKVIDKRKKSHAPAPLEQLPTPSPVKDNQPPLSRRMKGKSTS